MSCPVELNKSTKGGEKIQKCQQLVFETSERLQGFKVKIILIIIGCLGGVIRQLTNDLNELFKEEKFQKL